MSGPDEGSADAGRDAGRDGATARAQYTRRIWQACWAVLVAAAFFAGASGWLWWSTAHDEGLALAEARDEVDRAARDQIAGLHTIDHTDADAGLRQWLDATTGLLHDELLRTRTDSERRIEQARTTTAGRVTGLAVTAADPEAGTARVIATVTIKVTPDDGGTITRRNRYRATLNHTDAGWKVASLTAVAVGAR